MYCAKTVGSRWRIASSNALMLSTAALMSSFALLMVRALRDHSASNQQ